MTSIIQTGPKTTLTE